MDVYTRDTIGLKQSTTMMRDTTLEF